ncbi:MAG TPA: serine hydrolase domain-containing protein [Chitinophagaceae bacterium]|nr:serine hydrolase domain-containing protein [Chitinophagaceae bacterium]
MKKILLTTGLILVWISFVLAFFVVEEWLRRPSVRRGDFLSIENHLVQKLNDAAENKRLGAASLILIQNGRIKSLHGFGVVNSTSTDSVKTAQSLFFLASVSKAITAWGIMKLVQDKNIGLDEPVTKYLKRWRFPGNNPYCDKVTVRHLLSHTAGIDDGYGTSGFLAPDSLQSLEEWLNFPKDANMGAPHATIVVREPGTAISYSSAGYAVLQLLIEEVTNKSFNNYMKETVLQPLGMTRSTYDLDDIINMGTYNDLVPNYDLNLKLHPHRRYANMAGVSLRTTPHDLAQFLSAYYNENPVLGKEIIKQMVFPQPGTSLSWALGHEVYIANNSSDYIVGHGGGAFPRTGASMRVNPATGNCIAILMTGGPEMIDPLINDWIFWETGKMIFDIRNVFHNRFMHALVLIVLGTIMIILWKSRKRFASARQ